MKDYPVVAAIHNRHSVSPKYLQAPGPTPEEITQLVATACAAPDHGQLGPAEFIYVPDDMRAALADVFVAAAIEADPAIDEARQAQARERSLNGPCLLGLLVRLDRTNPTVPETEQWLSAGAAMQNMLLAAEAAGYRAKVVSGARVSSRAMRAAFRLESHEHLSCFIVIGTSEGHIKSRLRRLPEQALRVWQG